MKKKVGSEIFSPSVLFGLLTHLFVVKDAAATMGKPKRSAGVLSQKGLWGISVTRGRAILASDFKAFFGMSIDVRSCGPTTDERDLMIYQLSRLQTDCNEKGWKTDGG